MPWAHMAAAGPAPPGSGPEMASLAALAALVTAVCGCIAWFAWFGWFARWAWRSARWAWRIARRTSHFLDDYAGGARSRRPPRPPRLHGPAGVRGGDPRPRRPGDHPQRGKLHVGDVVARTAADVADIKKEQAAVRADLDLVRSRRTRT